MKRSELTEFAVEEEGFKLKIRRGLNGNPVTTSNGGPALLAADAVSNSSASGSDPSIPAAGADKEEAGIAYIKAPMVGTFYRSPSPESAPFVEADAKVVENSVICIIEAMKIMNEIQAEIKGTVLEILVENGQPVEYGQRLFKVKQA
jgi:acetyl-CoA carboxylase biotin carboxyl carrier protein